MEIISIKPRSYCKGVVFAIKKALETKANNPDKEVSLLGMIVHNQLVIDALEREGIHTIDEKGKSREELLDMVPEGIVLFSAHGVADSVKAKAKALGLEAIDATCTEVLFTDNLVQEQIAEGKRVFYVGKKGHPESTGITQGREGVYLIETAEDIPDSLDNEAIFVTNQTTLSVLDLKDVFEAIKTRYPQAEIYDEICQATRLRQEAVMKYDDLDVLLVIGDPNSNNTAMLAKIAEERGVPIVKRIESVEDLDLAWFKQDDKVGVTAGASTPPYLINQVEAYLEGLDLDNPEPLPTIDLDRILEMKFK